VDFKVGKWILGPVVGLDFAGVVEEVPQGHTIFKRGDEVYGTARGSLADYVLADPGSIAIKPTRLGFAESAALPTA
jgi:NADPH2:quinone reductase